MSADTVGDWPASTSGGRYISVPVSALDSAESAWVKPRTVMPSALSREGSPSEPLPKSATLICHPPPGRAATRILAGLRSLWSTPKS